MYTENASRANRSGFITLDILEPDEPINEPNESWGSDYIVLAQIKNNPLVTQKQMAEKTGLSESTVKRALVKLREEKKIVRIGTKRSGHWKVTG